jgi:hypothetical protein
MEYCTLNTFERLLSLARRGSWASDRDRMWSQLDVEEICFAVYDVDVVEELLLAAANRLADRAGHVLFRLDVEDGRPSFYLSFGRELAEARSRLAEFVERQEALA